MKGEEGCLMCGGCSMLGIGKEEQRRQRVQTLKEYFMRALNTDKLPKIKEAAGEDRGYRARIALDCGAFHKRHTSERVAVKHCIVATEEINEYLMRINADSETEEGRKMVAQKGRVQVFGDKRVISESNVGIKGVVEGREGEATEACVALNTTIGEKNVRFDVKCFFQSNLQMLELAIPLVCGGIEGENVLDMYSGCGTFSVFLSERAECVTMVEKDMLSIAYAQANMAGKKHKSYALSGSKWVKGQSSFMKGVNFSAAVIDPPRSGMEKEVREYLMNSKIPIIRSLSCDAKTHARDIASLVKAGYYIEDIVMLDFYPQTKRIESLCSLRLGGVS